MKIGLIAMSGVRAWSEELNRAGLTMPGVMERGAVIASLPSLSLLTLAGLTPPDVEVEYHEIRDLRVDGHVAGRFDLVAISTMSAQVFDAYQVADQYRALGAKVVMGGLHVTALPGEALRHCDAVVVGEAEPVWPRLVDDARRGKLQHLYRADADEEFDLADAPMPRFDLLDIPKYNRLTVQTSRGCPHKCDFCASSILLTNGYKLKPAAKVIAEIRRIKQLWDRPFIELADDNSFASRRHAKKLLRELAAEEVHWFTEADVSIAEDVELLDLMRASGCRQVLIGLESPEQSSLAGVELRRNWKLGQFPKYEAAVRTIQSRGITVNGCFILGLDGHTPAIFDEVLTFADRTSLFDVQITVLTPFPGTPLYTRLLDEGRILEPGAWHKCTLFDVNYVPALMTVQELEAGLLSLAGKLYHPDAVKKRREGYFNGLDRTRLRPERV
ncbi:MAG: B12-binding domain-containing radical SAM protein [Phycisphaerales bacterium]